MNNIIVSIVLGAIALVAAFSIYKRYASSMLASGLFAGGMLLLCILQAVLYGKKHVSARISIVLGLTFVALVFSVFRHLPQQYNDLKFRVE